MSKPQKLLGPHPSPKNSPIGPKKSKCQKTQNLTKLNLSAYKIKAPIFFRPHLNPKHIPKDPKKAQIDPLPNQKKSKSQDTKRIFKMSKP